MVLWHVLARTCRACVLGLLSVMGVLNIMCLVSPKATVIILSTKMHTTNVERGRGCNINIKYILFHLPTLVVCIFVLKIITVALGDTRYMICNTPITLSRLSTHA